MIRGDHQRPMSTDDSEPSTPLPFYSRALAASDLSASKNVSPNPSFPKEEMQIETRSQKAETAVNHSKKLQDDLLELGQKIKHHEESVNYLKTLKNKLEDSIIDMQVALGKYHTTSSIRANQDNAHVESEEETMQHILKYEKSAAALLCRIKLTHVSDNPFTKDVLGIVATLGKVDDENLSRLLSEYLGLDTMLAVVCKTYEGVKALEAYNKDGLIDNSLGIHSFSASTGRPLDDRFRVICLENLRPYAGGFIADDPQRRLDIVKPRLPNGETPHGFLGFAVNMVSIDYSDLYCVPKTGYNLRDTLFYNLFSTMQVYRSRDDMLKALPYIPNGAISLDGGVIRSPGVFSLGHHREHTDVKFPIGSKSLSLPESYHEIEIRMKETKWKKDWTWEDLQREQDILNIVKYNYEIKKQEFVHFLAESTTYPTQYQASRVSTPR